MRATYPCQPCAPPVTPVVPLTAVEFMPPAMGATPPELYKPKPRCPRCANRPVVLVKVTVSSIKSPLLASVTGAVVNSACTSMCPLDEAPMPNFKSFAAMAGVGLQGFEDKSWYAVELVVGGAGAAELSVLDEKLSLKTVAPRKADGARARVVNKNTSTAWRGAGGAAKPFKCGWLRCFISKLRPDERIIIPRWCWISRVKAAEAFEDAPVILLHRPPNGPPLVCLPRAGRTP